MITTVKNWSLVTIDDEKYGPFKVLWAIVEHDERGHYKKDDYVCSSRILYIEDNHVRTHTGSCYKLMGDGKEYVGSYEQLVLLRGGASPAELN